MERTEHKRGLLRRVSESYSLNDPELAAAVPEIGPSAWMQRTEALAAEVLQEAGLPSAYGPYFLAPTGEWIELPPNSRELGYSGVLDVLPAKWREFPKVQMCSIAELVRDRPLEAVDHAVEVIVCAHHARAAMTESNAARAFEWGARLGAADWKLRMELAGWPLASELGGKQIKNVRSGGAKEAIRRKEEAKERSTLAQRAAEEIWRRRPDLDNHAVAIQVARENPSLGSANTIRRKIRRPT